MHPLTRKLAEGRTIDDFLAALSRGRQLYALEVGEGGQYHLVRADSWDSDRHTLGAFRPIEPLKSLLFQPREFVGLTLRNAETAPLPERIVIGVKNCDLAGLKIQDHVFLDLQPGDPRYVEAREKTILVTCDCTGCLDVCFCPVVAEQPYAEEGFDINISPLSQQQYLIDAGSQKGEKLLEQVADYLAPPDGDLLVEREEQRAAMVQRLVEQAAAHGLRPGMDLAGAIRSAAESSLWEDFAVDCVECGACNFVCCTCHCFLLADGTACGDVPARGKQWDSCLLKNFARVAGGANPRSHRAARLRNRFQKKFNYFPDVLGCYACDGCGRCTEVCTGNIDIRAVLKRAADERESLPADTGND
jgi:sulfhydrogenase subunit beta (sulfur reductase)